MRKALIAIAVATALFAVGAFAASFAVNSEDVASGSNGVVACAAKVDVNLDTTYATASDDWTVTGALVTFYDAANAPTNGCQNHDVTVVLENLADNGTIGTGTAAVGTSTAQVSFAAQPLASAVGRASVLVDGYELFVDPTTPAP